MPKRRGQDPKEAAKEAWERYYSVVHAQNKARDEGEIPMPSGRAITRRTNKLAKMDADQRAAAIQERLDRFQKNEGASDPIEVYGWMKPDGSYLENEAGDIHADTITQELNPEMRDHYGNSPGWNYHKDESYPITPHQPGDYETKYGSMQDAYHAGFEKKYIRLTNTDRTMYAHYPSGFGEISKTQMKALEDMAIQNNMEDIVRDNGSGSKSTVIWTAPKELQNVYDSYTYWMPKPSIKSAAIEDKTTGKRYEAENHATAYNDYLRDNPPKNGRFMPYWDNPNTREGFTTTDGDFVDRGKGYDIAKEAGQLSPAKIAQDERIKKLFGTSPSLLSENLGFMPKPQRDAWEKYYNLVQEQNAARDQGEKMPSQLALTRRVNKLARATDEEKQKSLEQSKQDMLKRAADGNDRPKRVYGWVSPDGRFLENTDGDLHADTMARELNPDMEDYGKRRQYNATTNQFEPTGNKDYHDLYGGMTQTYEEGFKRGYLRLTDFGREMFVHYPEEYGKISKAQQAGLEKIAMDSNMDVIIRDLDDGVDVLWRSPQFGKRDDGLSHEWQFMPKQRDMNDKDYKSPYFIEKHGGVYAVVDRRRPDTVGHITPDLRAAQQTKYWLDETARPKTGASGLWDSTFTNGEGEEERQEVAKHLGVQEDKHYWEQSPSNRQKIKDYYMNQGADFMPKPQKELPPRHYVDDRFGRDRYIMDRLTGKTAAKYEGEDTGDNGGEPTYSSPQEMADAMNEDSAPLPPNWTGPHPDAFIPEVIRKNPDNTWGIEGPNNTIQGSFPTPEEANKALHEAQRNFYNPHEPARLDFSPKQGSLLDGFLKKQREIMEWDKEPTEPDTETPTPSGTRMGVPVNGKMWRERYLGKGEEKYPAPVIMAAIFDRGTGEVFPGEDHMTAYRSWDAGTKDQSRSDLIDGFIDAKGDFLSRKQAGARIGETGQVSPESSKYLAEHGLDSQTFRALKSFMPKPKEGVKENAAKLDDGTIITGPSQQAVFSQLRKKGLNPDDIETGYVTHDGKFLNSGEAYHQELAAGRGSFNFMPKPRRP